MAKLVDKSVFEQSSVSSGMMTKSGSQINYKLTTCWLNDDKVDGMRALRMVSAVDQCCWCGPGLWWCHISECLGDKSLINICSATQNCLPWNSLLVAESSACRHQECDATNVSGHGVAFRRGWNLSCCGAGEGCQLKCCDKCGAGAPDQCQVGLAAVTLSGIWEGGQQVGLL